MQKCVYWTEEFFLADQWQEKTVKACSEAIVKISQWIDFVIWDTLLLNKSRLLWTIKSDIFLIFKYLFLSFPKILYFLELASIQDPKNYFDNDKVKPWTMKTTTNGV